MQPHWDGALPGSSRAFVRATLLTLIAVGLPAYSAPATPSLDHQEWLDQVDTIITEEERRAFALLERKYQQEAFIARFWRERDPNPVTGQNEFLDSWQKRAHLAEEQFGGLDNDRSRTMLLLGLPELMLPDLCPELLRPMEAWYYDESASFPEGFYLIFVPAGSDPDSPWSRWSPEQGLSSLWRSTITSPDDDRLPRLAQRCTLGKEAENALPLVVGWEDLAEQHLLPTPPDSWVEEFLDRTLDVNPDTPTITAALQLQYPGHVQDRTVVQAALTLPAEMVAPTDPVDGMYSLRIDGEVVRRETLFDQFRYDFDLPVAEIFDGELPLTFQRDLLPGDYTLILRLEDRTSGHMFRSEGTLQVPHPAETGEPPDDTLSEANAVLGDGDHMVKIQPLPEELLTGRVRVEAQALGEGIAKVTFVLNGRQLMSKTRPPFSLEIDLGHAPRLHWLEAISFDSAGQELARDRVPVNAGPHSFAVRLVEPRSGQRYISSLRVSAEVHLPAGETLQRVDFYLNENRLASLYQPPFVQPLPLPQNQRITYVRAVAYLVDGNSTEDLVFINSPKDMASLRINMVELYTTVSDKKGMPVEGLASTDFAVREEGQEQEIRRFERVQDLSVHTGVIIDASTSMSEELEVAIAGAVQFFEGVILPKDRAAVFVFNDEPTLMVPFTNNLEALSESLVEVESAGETALYDTMVYSLHYFAGIRGKRALVLLSDGEDSRSRYTFAETLEFAQRSGVAVYAIALGLDRRQLEARNVLQRLARETGGRFFSIASARELEGIYSIIEQELRSQYLLTYQSTHEEGGDFRRVEVEVEARDLKAKTIPGYYP